MGELQRAKRRSEGMPRIADRNRDFFGGCQLLMLVFFYAQRVRQGRCVSKHPHSGSCRCYVISIHNACYRGDGTFLDAHTHFGRLDQELAPVIYDETYYNAVRLGPEHATPQTLNFTIRQFVTGPGVIAILMLRGFRFTF